MNTVPSGATHKAEFYGVTHYYRKVVFDEITQWSELPVTKIKWYWWDKGSWQDQSGKEFSPHRCEAI